MRTLFRIQTIDKIGAGLVLALLIRQAVTWLAS